MSRKIPLVAIVGRTNVGKSTLFNALAGRRLSIVEDSPGVTRDRHYALVTRYEFPFTLIDTGGMAGEQEQLLEASVKTQTEIAIDESDAIIAVFDGLSGPHPLDEEVVQQLRQVGKKVIYCINKCEKPLTEHLAADFYSLGIEDLVSVSAAHLTGIEQLVAALKEALGASASEAAPTSGESDEVIKVAVIGRPNVGKSSLINRILGEERLIASEIPGTTRDAINITLTREGQQYEIVDTAGLRKKARVDDLTVERFSNLRSLRALAECDVAVLVLDATQGVPSEQDAKIAGLIHERGRGFVIVVNKWDAVEKDHRTVKEFTDAVYSVFKFARYAPVLFVSALSGRRCPSVLETAKQVYTTARVRIPTSELNRILTVALQRKPPPVYRGEPIRLFFCTQTEVAPPTFVLFMNHPTRINFSYQRYIRNAIRKEYPYEGSDVRLVLRKRTSKAERDEQRAG